MEALRQPACVPRPWAGAHPAGTRVSIGPVRNCLDRSLGAPWAPQPFVGRRRSLREHFGHVLGQTIPEGGCALREGLGGWEQVLRGRGHTLLVAGGLGGCWVGWSSRAGAGGPGRGRQGVGWACADRLRPRPRGWWKAAPAPVWGKWLLGPAMSSGKGLRWPRCSSGKLGTVPWP